MSKRVAVVVGGSGFVGRHLLRLLLNEQVYSSLVVLDIVPPPADMNVQYIQADIRNPLDPAPFLKAADGAEVVIYNLAAICRIPGFEEHEYFDTNVGGAEHVTRLADDLGCRNIVFTSSMSVYGTRESIKHETTLPMPNDPYGTSKAIAEQIHLRWYEKGEGRRLQVLRPGIVFGLGEAANFTRLYNGIAKGYFVFPGRRDTLKACVYVKDVARAHLHFAENAPESFNLFNLVYPDAPRIDEITGAIARVTSNRAPSLVIPASLILSAANVLTAMKPGADGHFKFHPDRVRKLMISTNVSGQALKRYGFEMTWSLEEAIRDWYEDSDQKGLC